MIRRPTRKPLPHLDLGFDSRARQVSADISRIANRVLDRGLIAVPGMSMREIFGYCGTVDGAGNMTIEFSEGTFTFKDGFVLERSGIRLVGKGRATVFERSEDTTSVGSLLVAEGDRICIEGITFNDTGDNSRACIDVTGDKCVVKNCIFLDCYSAIDVNGASGAVISGNYIDVMRSVANGIHVKGGSSDGIVSGNVCEQTGIGAAIYFDDATLRFVIIGNQPFPGGDVSYRAADGHVASGNLGIDVR